MPCYHPLKGWRSRIPSFKGKFPIVFNMKMGYPDLPMTAPCGQCVGCRLERSRQWAMRCSHEVTLHESNCFITLTYRDADLPANGSLDVRVFQLFMKKLRKRFGSGIRFYHCGEYGTTNPLTKVKDGGLYRPHYHAIIFGLDFSDKVLWKITPQGDRLYTSEILSELWPYGFSTIGDANFKTAAYVARYIMKKVNGSRADDHYIRICDYTGEITTLKPEYTTMSRRPGIGKGWFDKFSTDVFPSDFLIQNGKKVRPPKYYDTQFEILDPDGFERIKSSRVKAAKKHVDNNTPERLYVREQVQLARLTQLHRKIDDDS